jgi:membrane dipeptidase
VLIIDAHLDLSMNAIQLNRDLLSSVYTLRTQESGMPGKGRGLGTVAFPEMRQGRIALSFATLIARSTGQPAEHIDFATPAQAYGVAQGQLAYYRGLEHMGHVSIITNRADLDSHIAAWEVWEAEADPTAAPALGLVISMEGADPILAPDQLEAWWCAGLRILGITHYGPGRYAGGTATEVGLVGQGPALLAEMDRLGMLLDLTHCSDQAFWEALDHYHGPVVASHNNARALVPNQRQLSDEQVRAIVERDGVIGVCADIWMLKPGWVQGRDTNENVTLADMAEHIDYICQLTGDSRHAAIGSDLDGGFGWEESPRDLETIADLQKLVGILAERGYAQPDIANIMHGNLLRLLREAWAGN